MRGKKLRGNGIWESSRIILPEHRSAIRQHRTELRKRTRPELDEQRWEELQIAISDAVESKQPVAVRCWGVYEDEIHVGVIERVDVLTRRLRIVGERETVWVPLGEIVNIES